MVTPLWIIAGILGVWFLLWLDRPRRERARIERFKDREIRRQARRDDDEMISHAMFKWALGVDEKSQIIKNKKQVLDLIHDRPTAVAFLKTRLDDPFRAEEEYERFIFRLEFDRETMLRQVLPSYLMGFWVNKELKNTDFVRHLQNEFGLSGAQAKDVYDAYLDRLP